MDPTRYLCQTLPIHNKIIIKKYDNNNVKPGSPKQRRQEILSPQPGRKRLQPQSLEVLQLPRILSNPLYNASDSFTATQLVMANIDAVFNLTGQEAGYLAPQYIKDYDVVDITGDSINYFQYRVPTTRFFTQNKSVNYLDSQQVNTPDSANLILYTRSIVASGVDLVIDTSDRPFRKRLTEALELCRPGAYWVCKLTILDPNLLYIAAQSFTSFTLFQPMADDTNTASFYLIAENFKGTATDWIQILHLNDDIDVTVPDDFLDYLEDFAEEYQKLIETLTDDNPQYNVYKCKAVWNIF